LEGDLLIEAGDERYRIKPGDSLWVRRAIPHVWANVANSRMRFLAFVSPAGNLEEFFINAAKGKVLPGPDPNNWQLYGLEWVGPPLKFD
jgi:Cupin domain